MGSLSAGLFKKLTRFPALLPDAYFTASLGANTAASDMLKYGSIASTGLGARLRDVASLSEAGVTLTAASESYSTQPVDTAAINLINPLLDAYGDAWKILAGQRLSLAVANGNAAAVANYWAAWGVELQEPSIAQKLQAPSTFGLEGPQSLDPTDQALAKAAGLLPPSPRGVLPRTLDWIIANEYRTQIINAAPLGGTQAVSPGNPTLFVTDSARDGEILVLAGFACSPGSGADGLTVVIGLDDDEEFYTLPAYPIGQAGFRPAFLQAKRIQFEMTSTTDVASASLAAIVWHCHLTDEISYRTGGGVPKAVADKIEQGVL